ncbi:MAG: SPOR domain-containing protein [candidate division WOR-3 bacterium]|nr:MAG: SPOR domain-containing protein [candidate division WOR-3 bacterium]
MQISVFFLSCLFSVFVVDSTLYHVDIEHETVDEINFPETIIDYVTADFTYIVTPDCLYKMDPARAQIIDRTPLPLRFNHVLLHGAEIILISTDEIIVLDRANLAFKSGIGIERGDHRPLIQNQNTTGILGHAGIILLSDDGLRSTLRKVDLESGRTIARLTLDHIKDVVYYPQDRIFIGLEEGGNLVIFDHLMNIRDRLHLHFKAIILARQNENLYIVSDHGVFLMTKDGASVDFLPLPGIRSICGSAIVTDDAIFWLDALTFRIYGWLQNSDRITQLLHDAGSDRLIGIDPDGGMYLIENTPTRAPRLRNYRRELVQVVPSSPRADSLWYVQLGAFSDQVNALLMYEEFRNNGIPVFVDTTELYRIKFGGFTDKPAALDIAEAMKLDGWLVFQPRKYRDESAIFYVGVDKFIIDKGIVRKE